MKKPTLKPGIAPPARRFGRFRARITQSTKPLSEAPKAPTAAPKAPITPKEKKERSAPAPAFYGLSPRQLSIIDHYLISGNATQAAIEAGYSAKSARSTGREILQNPVVLAEIRRRRAAMAEKFEVTAERVILEAARVAFANMGDYMRPGMDGAPVLDFANLTPDQAAALAEVTVEEFKDGRSDQREVRRIKFKLHPKVPAIELLMKRLGLIDKDNSPADTIGAIGRLLDQIDERSRGPIIKATIEHDPTEKAGA